MRHNKSFNHLGRTASHRKAMLSNMASQLIIHKRINTTVAKAKALRPYIEPLITKSKNDSTHSRRTVFSYLQNKEAINELFRDVSQRILDRPGGYTRILKTGFRKGDGAEMCFIELVDYNENMLTTTGEETQKRTRRGRRGGKKQTVAAGDAQQTTAPTKGEEQQPGQQEDTMAAGVEKAGDSSEDVQGGEDTTAVKQETPGEGSEDDIQDTQVKQEKSTEDSKEESAGDKNEPGNEKDDSEEPTQKNKSEGKEPTGDEDKDQSPGKNE